jgi:hypothetical protein
MDQNLATLVQISSKQAQPDTGIAKPQYKYGLMVSRIMSKARLV